MRKVEERVNDRAVERVIQVGDQVLVQQKKTHKLMPLFDPSPYEVIEVKGTMITAARPNHVITRNISHFKVLKQHGKLSIISESIRSTQQPNDPLLLPYKVMLLTSQAAGVQARPLPLMQLAVPPPPPPPPANAVVAAPNLLPVQPRKIQPSPPAPQSPFVLIIIC